MPQPSWQSSERRLDIGRPLAYTARGSAIRIISARKANGKEVADDEHNARQD